MKTKLSKIMGIGFTLVLVASMMLFAIPVAAGPYQDLAPVFPNTWAGFPPTPGALGSWFFDPAITQVGPIAEAINGDLYAYVAGVAAATPLNDGTNDIFKSTDGGRTWTVSSVPGYFVDGAGLTTDPVVDMVCSSVSEDVIYLTDGNYVYKSVNGGVTFMIVAEDSLETMLVGACGPSVVLTAGTYITCLDIGYNAAGDSYVFIGVTVTFNVGVDTPPDLTPTGPASVLYINEAGYPSAWADLGLRCFRANGATPGGYVPYSIGVSPNFATSKKIYVAVTVANDICATCPDYVVGVDPRTYVVSSVGIFCSWNVVDQLFWDCDSSTPKRFNINHASRFAFPSDYATTGAMFIGVVGVTVGGDVYIAYDTPSPLPEALDLNVQGYTTGCFGLNHANICSLDINENNELIAGAWDSYQLQSPTRTYYSADDGWTWSASAKDPTGTDRAYVLFSGASAVAGTRGYDCAFSLSCGDVIGTYWNQISLINMAIDEVLDMSHAPGYVNDSSIMYVLTWDDYGADTVDINSLLRWDGTYWERVHSTRFFNALGQVFVTGPLYDWVEVSPDFNDTGCVYMANTLFGMTRTVDMGCSWRVLSFPCAPLPTISAWIVVDEETVLAAGSPSGGSAEFIYKTDRHGTRPWTFVAALTASGAQSTANGVDFDLSLPRGPESDVLFSDAAGRVYISQDMATTPFAEIADIVGFASFNAGQHNTYCVFDPGYGTAGDPGENMIYAAAGTLVGRCNLNSAALWKMQDWVYISTAAAACDPFDLKLATGIAAAGDTALYVSDAGSAAGTSEPITVGGSIVIQYYYDDTPYTLTTCDVEVDMTDPWVMWFTTTSGTFVDGEPLNILSFNLVCGEHPVYTGYTTVKGELIVQGLTSGAIGIVHISEIIWETCPDCVLDTGVILISGVLTVDVPTPPVAVGPTGVWRTLNPMDLMPPAWPVPLVEWEFLSLDAGHSLIHPQAGLAGGLGVYPDDLWLTQASNMLWCLDDMAPSSPTDTIWMWEDPLATPVIQVSPANEALLATTSSATLEWTPLDGALAYEVMIFSFCPTCPANMAFFDDFTTDLTCIVIDGLTPGTQYFWKVRVACDSPYVSKWSDLRSFDTALSAVPYLCSPWCGQTDVILTTNFSWDAVAGSTGYELQIAAAGADGTANFTGATSYTSAVNAFASIPGLDYSTVYYWRVRAVNDGVYSAWSVCLFTTEAVPVVPVVEEVNLVQTTEEITPMWIWVIIAIGGALTIAVVVLIVTTRRVP